MAAAAFSGPEIIKQALEETVKEMGLSSLKSKQTEAIFAVVAGKYSFVSFPTGYGKSAQQHLSLMTATPWPADLASLLQIMITTTPYNKLDTVHAQLPV